MNDMKFAILRTFESTVKALLEGHRGEMDCTFGANSNAEFGEICSELREIRTELTEMRTQMQQLEKRMDTKPVQDCGSVKKVANIVVDDIWPTADDIDDDMFRHSLLGQMPIPLHVQSKGESPHNEHVANSATPELRPRAAETEENVPDIHDEEVHEDKPTNPVVEAHEDKPTNTVVEPDEDKLTNTVVEPDEEEGEEEEEEEEAVEEEEEGLDEVTYKGNTYYKDDENLVYTLNDEGELIEDAVGRWYDDKQIVKFFAKPTQIIV